MHKIKRVSKMFRILFQVVFILLPIGNIIGWMQAPKPIIILQGIFRLNVIPHTYQEEILHNLSYTEKGLGLLASCIPLAIQLSIVYFLIRLFKCYERGEIFSLKNVNYIKKIGYGLLISEIIIPVHQFIAGVILTMHNPPGHRFASMSWDQTNLGILLIALLVILISWIMAEGYRLQQDQELTI